MRKAGGAQEARRGKVSAAADPRPGHANAVVGQPDTEGCQLSGHAVGLAMVTPPPRPRPPPELAAAEGQCRLRYLHAMQAGMLERQQQLTGSLDQRAREEMGLLASLAAAHQAAEQQQVLASRELQALLAQLAALRKVTEQPGSTPPVLCLASQSWAEQSGALMHALEAGLSRAAPASTAGTTAEQHAQQQAELGAVRAGLEASARVEAASCVATHRCAGRPGGLRLSSHQGEPVPSQGAIHGFY